VPLIVFSLMLDIDTQKERPMQERINEKLIKIKGENCTLQENTILFQDNVKKLTSENIIVISRLRIYRSFPKRQSVLLLESNDRRQGAALAPRMPECLC